MNPLQLPPALHFCITRPNTAPGVAEAFLEALHGAVDYATQHKGESAKSGAVYGFGGTPQGNALVKTVMVRVLDAMHEVAPDARRLEVLTWASAGSSPSTSATGARRSQSCSLDGEVLSVAFRPVHVRVGRDGAVTQDAVEWWDMLRDAAREAIEEAGADGDAAARRRRHRAVGVVGADRRRRPARRRRPDLVRHARSRSDARGHRRTAERRRLRAAQGAALHPHHGRGAGAERRRSDGPLAAAAASAHGRLRQDEGDPRAGGLPGPVLHGAGGGDAGVDHGLVAHRQPARARRPAMSTSSSGARAATGTSCPSCCRWARCSGRCFPGSRPISASRRGHP